MAYSEIKKYRHSIFMGCDFLIYLWNACLNVDGGTFDQTKR